MDRHGLMVREISLVLAEDLILAPAVIASPFGPIVMAWMHAVRGQKMAATGPGGEAQ